MTPKGHTVIRGHCDLHLDPKVKVTFLVGLTNFMTPKVTGSLEVAVTYFMSPKVNLNFDLDLRVKHLSWQSQRIKVTMHFTLI